MLLPDSLQTEHLSFVDIMGGIADVLRAIAWPGVAVFVVIRYRNHVGRLIDRLRKAPGTEFDPLEIQKASTTEIAPAAVGGSGDPVASSTPHIREIERFINTLPEVRQVESDAPRLRAVLTNIAARGLQAYLFERAEAVIWKSQLDILQFLNASPNGSDLATLKRLFYDPMIKVNPHFASYPFDSYLRFLQTTAPLIEISGGRAMLTDAGRDYLEWRLAQKKPPRLLG